MTLLRLILLRVSLLVTKVKMKCTLCGGQEAGLCMNQKLERNPLQSGVKSSVERLKIGADAFQTSWPSSGGRFSALQICPYLHFKMRLT